MPLLSLMESNPTAVQQLNIEQVVKNAGDGHLKDGTVAQSELRKFLQQVSVEILASYVNYCLAKPFEKSGFALQDIANELGRRLDYEVINGRYQGVINSIGFDGLWHDCSGSWIIAEVKTTDAYRLSLDVMIKYRKLLLEKGEISLPCSVLIIVGRSDTGELEAQVRGSRHAWDIRLISVDSLIDLVRIKENADSLETNAKIRKLLSPLEYTRLDELVDVVFTTAKDLETSINVESGKDLAADEMPKGTDLEKFWNVTPNDIIQDRREKILNALGKKVGANFIKKSRALYWNAEHSCRVACTISKLYENQGAVKYWYAYHPQWHEFLAGGGIGYLALGGVGLNIFFALPVSLIRDNLANFHTTEKKDGKGHYYHLKIADSGDGKYSLQLPLLGQNVTLDSFSVPL